MAIKPKPIKAVKRKILSLYKSSSRVNSSTTDTIPDAMRNIVAFDGGNGKMSLGFVQRDKTGMVSIKRMTLPHARRRVTGMQVDRDGRSSVVIPYADFEGIRWGYTDIIFDVVSDRPIEKFDNVIDRYGSTEHVFYALLLLAEQGYPSGEEINIIVSVPPAYYSEVKDAVRSGFQRGSRYKGGVEVSEYDGWWEIVVNGKVFTYRFNDVDVVMEGGDAGFAAFRFNVLGEIMPIDIDGSDALSGNCRVFDGGYGTFDTPTLNNGVLITDDIFNVSDARGGIKANVTEPIADTINQILRGQSITSSHVDSWLRRYTSGFYNAKGEYVTALTPEAGRVLIGGMQFELHDAFQQQAERYAEFVIERYVSPAMRQGVDSGIEVGGAWILIHNNVRRIIGDQFSLLAPTDVPHMKSYGWPDINMIGMLSMRAAEIRYEV